MRTRLAALREQFELLDQLARIAAEEELALSGNESPAAPGLRRKPLLARLAALEAELAAFGAAPGSAAEESQAAANRAQRSALARHTGELIEAWRSRRQEALQGLAEIREGRRYLRGVVRADAPAGIDLTR